VGDTIKVGNAIPRLRILIIFIITLMVSSCVQQSGGSGAKTNKVVSTPTSAGPTPTFSSPLNILQNGSVQTTGSLNLQTDFADGLYLRGEEINRYISNGNTTQSQCIVVNFSLSGASKKPLVMTALPQLFYNFTTQVTEYYYLIAPGNKNQNEDFCKKAGLITALSNLYPGSTNAYTLKDICPNCTNSLYVSDYFKMYSSTGGIIANINVSYLTLRVNAVAASTAISGTACSSSNECKSLGYDCCSLGQCIKDKALKDGANTSSQEYLDALAAIAIEANSIYNYPNFFYLCGAAPAQDPETPTSGPVNAELDAQKRFTKLKDLYDCTTLIDGEASICNKTYATASSTGTFASGIDDRNFNTNYYGTHGLLNHSIYEIIHADETLYKNGTSLVPGSYTIGTGNDNLTDATNITLNHTASAVASNRDLKVRYKVDGSCRLVNTSLAICDKYFVQGKNTGSVMDHFPASKQFAIPYYADMTRSFKVEVDNIVRSQDNEWKVVFGLPNQIEFIDATLKVTDAQQVKITYYVNLSSYPTLITSKTLAQDEINTMCSCGGITCSLEPVTEARAGSNVVTNYSCVYPAPTLPEPPLQQTVYISSKTAPHRFFDTNGVSQSSIVGTTMFQEKSGDDYFQYEGGDALRPNNRNKAIGFDEIYGNFSVATSSAQPAKEIRVVKGRNYDLFVDSGAYSTCVSCGNDYWSSVTRLFPQSFLYKGGGILPSISSTNRTLAGEFRADDLLFGRACHVPATMIPWSHRPGSTKQEQRKNRMRAQHFMYANGYQRDWYGFDIGSVIGSFDGINWFSIGSQRRIKATTNRMWIAINAPYADLTADSSYKVTVSDASTAPFSGSFVTTNYDSDGAQCQKYHVCSNDQDCATQLGWDYVCQNVTDIYTAWPQIDSNGDEIPGSGGSSANLKVSLSALFGPIGNGGTKRCIYRGGGSPCTKDYTKFAAGGVSVDNAYNSSTSMRTHACSNNNYCQELKTGTTFNALFNTKISRFAKSVTAQNADSVISPGDLDTFGLGTRILGHPYQYNGTEAVDLSTAPQFSNNNVEGLCIPGKFVTPGESFKTAHSKKPATDADYTGDQVLGIGMTQGTSAISAAYLSSCPAFDELTKNNVAYNLSDAINIGTSNTIMPLLKLAASQNITTNALDIFNSVIGKDLTANFSTNQITTSTYQEHRCLRAPGAACFTDQDCGPNYLATKNISSISSLTNASGTLLLNDYELKFWQEDLVCGQKESKTSSAYLLKNNRCCRETSKLITLPSLEEGNALLDSKRIGYIKMDQAVSSQVALSDKDRISRIAPALYKMNNEPSKYPKLASASANKCTGACKAKQDLQFQYNTLHEILGKSCCSGNWIREFHTDNGKGHRWDSVKHQRFDKRNFTCLNWSQDTIHPSRGKTCGGAPPPVGIGSTAPDDADCFAKQTTDTDAALLFELLSGMELLGVPQISLPSAINNPADHSFDNLRCSIAPTNGGDISVLGNAYTLPGTTVFLAPLVAQQEYIDGGLYSYSATDPNNFSTVDTTAGKFSAAKMVFSDNQFSCCTPAGETPPAGSTDDACCTGFKNPQNSKCQLKDFTNVSVYFNRYISSAAKDLSPGLINSQTGFIENINDVEQLLVLLDVCASGTYARGVALADLKVPGHEADEYNIRRFVDKAGEVKGFSELFDAGLHWNTNVYCFPRATGGGSTSTIGKPYR
jgi:hypothetical protein